MSAAYALCQEARRRAGLSQRTLADRAGVAASTVARIERGRMEPTLEMLQLLIEACGQELRIQMTEIDWSGRTAWGDLSFEDRLAANRSVAELAEQLRAVP